MTSNWDKQWQVTGCIYEYPGNKNYIYFGLEIEIFSCNQKDFVKRCIARLMEMIEALFFLQNNPELKFLAWGDSH